MKKILLFLFAVLTSAFAMAQDITWDFSVNTDWKITTTKTVTRTEYTNSAGYTIALTGSTGNGFYFSNSYLMLGKSGATLEFPAFTKPVSKIEVYGTTGASESVLQNIYVGSTAVSTQTKGAKFTKPAEGCNTYEIASAYQAAGNVYVLKVESAHNTQITAIKIYFANQNAAVAPSLPTAGVFTTTPYDVTITNNESGATVYYTTDGTDPTTSSTSSFTGASKTIQINATTTVKAMAVIAGKDNSSIASATYTYEQSIANTKETAYTTAQAIALIEANSAQLTTTDVYVKGTVSKVDSFNDSYGSITYWLDDDAFEVYGGLDNKGEKFESIASVQNGAEVVVWGKIKKFVSGGNTIYEIDKNNWLVDYKAPAKPYPTLTLSSTKKNTIEIGEVNVFGIEGTDGEISCESSDTEVATIAWNGEDCDFTVTALKAGTTKITIRSTETANYQAAELSYTLTVTEKFVAAAIPFEFDGGKADVTPGKGMTQTGLSSDYNSSPKLKFDTTADELVINIAEAADYLHYVIKGNSYADAKDKEPAAFDVQESANGTEYTSLKHYGAADLKEQLAENNVELSATTRYIKFVYTNKAAGNVALGAIKINNEVTGINTVETEGVVKVQKAVKNGRLVIEKAGKQYNAAGAMLK